MAKRGYKLREFVAHSTNVNCLCIGKKACRLFITGGDDHKVNLWTVGQPASLMSLCGHTSPIESVSFDTAEVLVLAGASSGAIKMWDLEEAKMVRTLTGHRSNCTAVEFHPFGEFFASGSSDTNLRIWDIRKKGCIHTYKGHTRGISTIKCTPDGRWVVSGGLDNVVKIWDLTAGKLLHDFKFHEGHIRSIDFHPLEFLLATGSADRTVKFWDLETFELIGSSRPEASGVRAMSFHPDGRTLFCGLEDSLKVYTWEPVVSRDSVEVGWSTLGDLCIHDDKLLGCSFYRNSVGVWVADLSLIEPYGVATVPEKSNIPRSPPEKVGNGVRSASSLRSRSPDCETKEIKNIYVDCPSENPVAPQKVGSLNSPKVVVPFNSKEMGDATPEKTRAIEQVDSKSSGQADNKSFVAPSIVPRESPLEKDSARETITFSKTKPGMLLRPAHIRRPSNSRNDMEKLSANLESGLVSSVTSKKESARDLILQTDIVSEDATRKPCEEKISTIKSASEKLEKVLLSETQTSPEKSDGDISGRKETAAVKIVNGVAVVAGRTRSLVERFERREKFGNDDQPKDLIPSSVPETKRSPSTAVYSRSQDDAGGTPSSATTVTPQVMPETEKKPEVIPETDKILQTVPETEKTPTLVTIAQTVPETEKTPTLVSIAQTVPETEKTPTLVTIATPQVIAETVKERTPQLATNRFSRVLHEREKTTIVYHRPPRAVPEMERTSIMIHSNSSSRSRRERTFTKATDITIVLPERDRTPPAAYTPPPTLVDMDRTPPTPRDEPQTSGRETSCASYADVTEDLMETHDMFLSTLKSRLTKLQVIQHSWVQNDIKGAVDAMRRLPDHSVQADIISVLMEKMEIITLDLFSCLLPVLLGLLDSKMDRHLSISLEMLLKLVAVFGPRINSTVSAPPSVGVDLHLEERRECCKKCYVELQKIEAILPVIIRKGGVLARSARELNLVLQQS